MATQPIDLDPKDYVATMDLLKNIDFLGGVQESEMKTMLFTLQKQHFAQNATILFQGEISNRLFMLCAGSVVIFTKNKGNKIILAELKPPMYFGEISLLRPTSATATAVAGEEGADVLILPHESLAYLRKKIPDIEQRIQKIVDTRIASKQKAKDADNQD